MKRIIKNILPVIIILSLITTGIIIPQNIQGRVWIKKEETFGGPGEDPVISLDPLESDNNQETAYITGEDYADVKEISTLKIHLKLLFNQLTGLIF